jgi:Flp pilus assembly CpaF family ATPase
MKKYQIEAILNPFETQKIFKMQFDCANCQNSTFFTCVICILKGIIENDANTIRKIKITNHYLDPEEVNILLNIGMLYNEFQKIKLLKKKLCDVTNCPARDYYLLYYDRLEIDTFFPILELLYNNKNRIENIENLKFEEKCPICIEKLRTRYHLFELLFKKSPVYSNFTEICVLNCDCKTLFGTLLPKMKKFCSNHFTQFETSKQIEKYIISNTIYEVQIISLENEKESLYRVKENIPGNFEQKQALIMTLFESNLNQTQLAYGLNLGKKIHLLNSIAANIIKRYFPNLTSDFLELVSLSFSLESLKLKKIFPLLMDQFIEEIFLDSMDDNIYINHQKYGRCKTEIRLDNEDIEAIKTHLRLESIKRLDKDQPSLIHVINNEYFNCRFSIDIYPSHWKDCAIDIRKMNKNVFTIFDLILLKTLDFEMAAFLILCLFYRINITIAGEVDSGKTTLLNALDLLVPSEFRKIYVEENIETLEIPTNYGHQLKYIVEPEIDHDNNKKGKEIYKLLHRSGDLVILGEILSEYETKALFHCLSAGLKGIQTTHASKISGLLNRWMIHYKIEKDCLNDLGIIIFMKKINNSRIITSINEINYEINNQKIEISNFFEYNPQLSKWLKKDSIANAKFLTELNSYLYLPIEIFEQQLDFVKEEIQKLSKLKISPKYNPLRNFYPKLQQQLKECEYFCQN